MAKAKAAVPDAGASRPLARGDAAAVSADDFRAGFGEELARALDLDTWKPGRELSEEYDRIEREVREAVAQEDDLQREVRERVFPKLALREHAPKNAGKHTANVEALSRIQRGLLFNGGVEACDGTVQTHDTLPLTVYQVGVSLVSYRGDQGTWCQRLFRRDLRRRGADPVDEVLDVLERRDQRAALNRPGPDDPLGEMVQRALMTYAERALLLYRSQAVWRMGHGNPVPYELLTGGHNLQLMVAATNVLRELVLRHQKFVFVASEPRERLLLSIGQALRPLEFAIIGTLDDWQREWFRQDRFAVDVTEELDWDGEKITPREWIPRFLDEVSSRVVVGLYRATRLAPAQLFYAHADHADVAAHVVLADSLLQEHRGFPLLIDLAHHLCGAVFGGTLHELTEAAYAAAGAPWRYFSERATRGR